MFHLLESVNHTLEWRFGAAQSHQTDDSNSMGYPVKASSGIIGNEDGSALLAKDIIICEPGVESNLCSPEVFPATIVVSG